MIAREYISPKPLGVKCPITEKTADIKQCKDCKFCEKIGEKDHHWKVECNYVKEKTKT
jgi:hypothetical protein